jgi:hypothetical protein
MKAQDFLNAGLAHMQDRAATYDKPTGERSMAATVAAFKCVSGVEMTEEQGWLFMGLLKMVRSQQGEFKADNYEDEAAYAALRGECASAVRAVVAGTGVTNADGWIKWDGGECPLECGGLLWDVKYSDGVIVRSRNPEGLIGWHGPSKYDDDKSVVIAYRIHKAAK